MDYIICRNCNEKAMNVFNYCPHCGHIQNKINLFKEYRSFDRELCIKDILYKAFYVLENNGLTLEIDEINFNFSVFYYKISKEYECVLTSFKIENNTDSIFSLNKIELMLDNYHLANIPIIEIAFPFENNSNNFQVITKEQVWNLTGYNCKRTEPLREEVIITSGGNSTGEAFFDFSKIANISFKNIGLILELEKINYT